MTTFPSRSVVETLLELKDYGVVTDVEKPEDLHSLLTPTLSREVLFRTHYFPNGHVLLDPSVG